MFGESKDERGAGVSRRALLTGACVTGAAAMVGGLNACAPPQDAGPGGTGSGANGGVVPVSKAPSKVDKTYGRFAYRGCRRQRLGVHRAGGS